MLTWALAATLIGFGLLVVALITGNFGLAIACIVVCVIGLVLLVVDTVRSGRRGGAGVDDEPLFTIRDRDGAPDTRTAPLLDDDAGAGSRTTVPGAEDLGTANLGAGVLGAANLAAGDPAAGGLGDLVDTSAVTAAVAVPVDPEPVTPVPAGPAPMTGDANDYIKSVTGSFPVPNRPAPQSGAWPMADPPYPGMPQADAPQPGYPGEPPVDTGPVPASPPYVGRRRATAEPASDPLPEQSDAPLSAAGPAVEREVPLPPSRRAERRESLGTPLIAGAAVSPNIGDGSDALIVHDHTGELPKITFTGDSE